MPTNVAALPIGLAAGIFLALLAPSAVGQDWRAPPEPRRDDAYRPPQPDPYRTPPPPETYRRPLDGSIRPPPRDETYRPTARDDTYRPPARDYGQPPAYQQPTSEPPPVRYGEPAPYPPKRYGEPYAPPPAYEEPPPPPPSREEPAAESGSFSSREILDAGHGFFGSISKGLASVIEHSFNSKGRPNGYILGQDAGGALVAGLRYGEGVLYTKDAGTHRIFWQGPSIGWDAGAEGSKVMVLVYNLRNPEQIYQRFAGVAGSAYFVGGVGITFQESDDIVVAPIRAGIGLRFGANVGYLKYTRRPTWNPF